MAGGGKRGRRNPQSIVHTHCCRTMGRGHRLLAGAPCDSLVHLVHTSIPQSPPPSAEAQSGNGPDLCPSVYSLCLKLDGLFLLTLLRGPSSSTVLGHGAGRLQACAAAFSPMHDGNMVGPFPGVLHPPPNRPVGCCSLWVHKNPSELCWGKLSMGPRRLLLCAGGGGGG